MGDVVAFPAESDFERTRRPIGTATTRKDEDWLVGATASTNPTSGEYSYQLEARAFRATAQRINLIFGGTRGWTPSPPKGVEFGDTKRPHIYFPQYPFLTARDFERRGLDSVMWGRADEDSRVVATEPNAPIYNGVAWKCTAVSREGTTIPKNKVWFQDRQTIIDNLK